ncbi:MAG: FxsA family protein [Rhodospirillales bacterium]|jgi:UPF0716 protein FxsA|nr:FxsA family protein [Rhodospirillales bacterium]
MGYIIFFLFVGVPIIEITVFIAVGDHIGLWPTLAAIFLTAAIGTWMLRTQGLGILSRVQEHLNQRRFPMAEVFDGLCLLVAGAFLLTPGFVTDGVGFLLFFPPFRALIKQAVGAVLVARGGIHVYTSENGTDYPIGPGMNGSVDNTVIDGEYEEVHTEEHDNDSKRIE